MAMKGKRQKIDWDNIKISIVPADKNNPNPLNPCSKFSKKEREREIVSISARIWARAMKERMLKNYFKKQLTDKIDMLDLSKKEW